MRMYVFEREGKVKEILEATDFFRKDKALCEPFRSVAKTAIDSGHMVVLLPDNNPNIQLSYRLIKKREEIMKVNPKGFRKDLKEFFEKYVTVTPEVERQKSPFIVITDDEVRKVATVDDLLLYSGDTEVLQAWPGKTKADVFYFKVEDLQAFLEIPVIYTSMAGENKG